MSLFKKGNKSKGKSNSARAGKINQIENKELKEAIGNTALSTLTQGEHYESLTGLSVEFGYLYEFEGHGIEALIKVITDKGTYYFAAQKASIIRLDFDEAKFELATESFLGKHNTQI